MDFPLRLIVEWPNRTRLPVRLSASATGADLIKLLQFCLHDDSLLALVVNGICIQPRETLFTQRIEDDSLIHVVPFSPTFDFPMSSDEEFDELETIQSSIQAEALRIADLQMTLVDGAPKCGNLYRQYLREIESDDTIVDPEPTVLTTNPEIREDPLPMWPNGLMDQASQKDIEAHLTKPRRARSGWSW
jgi:hypothetical protein